MIWGIQLTLKFPEIFLQEVFPVFYRHQKEKQFAETAAAQAVFGFALSNAEGICWATLKVRMPQDLIKET